jgi:glutamate N-acetyltransferase/amino-acid N-acetyltransferase
MLICVSSGVHRAVEPMEFQKGLEQVCGKLAEDIVRNGEGTGHVIRVTVEGAADAGQAKQVGKGVINSPLVKTAVFGNDPNVGRILMAVGDCTGRRGIPISPGKTEISIGNQVVFKAGRFLLDQKKEETVTDYLKQCSLKPEGKRFPEHERTVDIRIDLASGTGQATVLGSDLSYEYIRENADYRT